MSKMRKELKRKRVQRTRVWQAGEEGENVKNNFRTFWGVM